jgi:hypothetical protein
MAALAGTLAAQSSRPAPKPPAKTTKTATVSKTASATKQAPSRNTSATARKTPHKSTTPVVHTAAAHPRQLTPTPQRYHEIQDALVAKGYLQPEQATGGWDQNSVDALKRFQAEQSLDVSGRISSLSLIALGLGPRHDSDPLPSLPAGPQDQR